MSLTRKQATQFYSPLPVKLLEFAVDRGDLRIQEAPDMLKVDEELIFNDTLLQGLLD